MGGWRLSCGAVPAGSGRLRLSPAYGRLVRLSFFTRLRRRPDQEPPSAEREPSADRDPVADGEPVASEETGRKRRILAGTVTAVAALLVLAALIAPNQLTAAKPAAFVSIPAEALVAAALALVLPARWRRILAVPVGVFLGLLVIAKTLDMGFYFTLDRPFDPVYDWSLLGDGLEFVRRSYGRLGAIGVQAGAVLLVVAALAVMTASTLRVTGAVARHRRVTSPGIVVFGLVWVTCAVLGVQVVPGLPVASTGAATFAWDRTLKWQADLKDKREFTAQSAVDAFAGTPAERMLTGLRGKDVIVTFVESYGRVALQDPQFAPQVDALLDTGTRQLAAAGYAARSGWLTSPTFGGGSWLAHSTLMSGLWINNQQRYLSLLASQRLTLNRAFQRADWRTVGVLPAVNGPWPQGEAFYRYNRMYTAKDLAYQGPPFNFGSMPDQYTLSTFQHAERAAPGHAPLMAQIVLLSSHAPWAPLPHLIAWGDVGNGSVYGGMPATGTSAASATGSNARLRAAYLQAVQYTLSTLISYVLTYGDDHLVLVFLGDHQPSTAITGEGASRDVPITVVSRDRTVLDRISGWGWQAGLRPAQGSPVWRMDAFRDRFLTAFGSQPAAAVPASPPPAH